MADLSEVGDPQETKQNETNDIISLSDEVEEVIKDEYTNLTDDQWKQMKQDGYCMIDPPLKNIMAVNTVFGYIRQNFSQECMVDELIRTIIKYFNTRYNADLYVELICTNLDDKDKDKDKPKDNHNDEMERFLVPKINISLSVLLKARMDSVGNPIKIDIKKVPVQIMHYILRYLGHHKDKVPDPLPCPVRSIYMKQIVSDQWDADYVDAFSKKDLFEITLAANYLECKSLVQLVSAKIATLIKQLDQKEINRIIEEEERYRREHASQDD